MGEVGIVGGLGKEGDGGSARIEELEAEVAKLKEEVARGKGEEVRLGG